MTYVLINRFFDRLFQWPRGLCVRRTYTPCPCIELSPFGQLSFRPLSPRFGLPTWSYEGLAGEIDFAHRWEKILLVRQACETRNSRDHVYRITGQRRRDHSHEDFGIIRFPFAK